MYDRVVGSRTALLVWLGLSGCGNLLGISDLSGPSDAGGSDTSEPLLPECTAQRYIQIVGGNGGLAWFTLLWPAPAVIQSFDAANFAFDDPSFVTEILTDSSHPLYSRLINDEALFKGKGKAPHPSVLVAGKDDAHVTSPGEIMTSSTGITVAAEAAALQVSMRPTVGAIVVSTAGPYGQAPGAPAPVAVGDVSGMAAVLPATAAVTQDQMSRYFAGSTTTAGSTALGTALALAANAFRDNALGTLIVSAYNDDPHGAWTMGNGVATNRADEITRILNALETDLASTMEPTCGHDNQPISLADNTVIAIIGDTYKNPFVRTNWQDGTPANSNLLFLRSNGFVTPGWFGRLDDATTIRNFNPADGSQSAFGPGVDPLATAAVNAATFYAISRGDIHVVEQITTAEFVGLRGISARN